MLFWVALAAVAVLALLWYSNNERFERFKASSLVVVITGASSGIGEELALQLSGHGNKRLLLSARRVDELEKVAEKCRAKGAREVKTLRCDVSVEEDCRALVEFAAKEFGKIDVLILNAGVLQAYNIASAPDTKLFRQTLDVNFYGCVYPAYYALKYLQQTKGRLVVVSSVAGYLPAPGVAFYHASKHSLEGFFRSLRLELAGTGVSVTLINPGFVHSPMADGASIIKKDGTVGTKMKYPCGGFFLMNTDACARQVIWAIGARSYRLIVPWFYSILTFIYGLIPGVLDTLGLAVFSRMKPQKNKDA